MECGPGSELAQVQANLNSDWKWRDSTRFLITGGTGFFGKWILESLIQSRRSCGLMTEAWVVSRNPARFAATQPSIASDPSIHLLEGDLVTCQLPAISIHVVLHLAGDPRILDGSKADLTSQAEAFRTHILGTSRLLEWAQSVGVQRFLLASSGAVYGKATPHLGQIEESYQGPLDWVKPNSCYAQAKRASELLALTQFSHSGLQVVIARCFGFVGRYMPLNGHFALSNFFANALAGKNIQVHGDGTAQRSFMYMEDLVSWLWALAFQGRPGEAYNVGSEYALSIREWAELVAKHANRLGSVEVLGQRSPAESTDWYVPSTAKIRQELGVRESHSPDEAIARTWEWLQTIRA